MEEAFKKHIEKMKKSNVNKVTQNPESRRLKTNRSKNTSKSPFNAEKYYTKRTQRNFDYKACQDKTLNDKDYKTLRESETSDQILRGFTSFGSKIPTTPSTSKRSSNDVQQKGSIISQESNLKINKKSSG